MQRSLFVSFLVMAFCACSDDAASPSGSSTSSSGSPEVDGGTGPTDGGTGPTDGGGNVTPGSSTTGALDATFKSPGGDVYDLALMAGGKIVIGGAATGGNGWSKWPSSEPTGPSTPPSRSPRTR